MLGHLSHLHAANITLAVVSRTPLARIEPFKARVGWTFPAQELVRIRRGAPKGQG